ncbi:MAG: lipopolysaccharide assembly LapA domain-containing protein [Thermodesulfobacteriota bacterium]
MRWVKTLFWMMAFFFAIHFSIQNSQEVSIRYSIQNIRVFEVGRIPIFLIILCSVFLGVLIGGVGDFYGRLQLKRTLRQNQRMIERLEREIESSRSPRSEQASFLKKED